MEKALVEEFKKSLEAKKQMIQKELETFAEKDPNLKHNWDAKYPNREDGDKEDEADEVQEYDNSLSLEYSLESKLRDVNVALEKIENGGYGVCENCRKEIERERLVAYPEARTCLKHNHAK